MSLIIIVIMLLIKRPESKEVIITIILSISPIYLIPKSTMMTMIIKLIPYFLSLPLFHLLHLVASYAGISGETTGSEMDDGRSMMQQEEEDEIEEEIENTE